MSILCYCRVLTEKVEPEVGVASIIIAPQELGEEVDVGEKSRGKDYWKVGDVEKFYWISTAKSTIASVGYWKFNSDSLKVDHD